MNFSLQAILHHFGFKSRPFTLVPDPKFLYFSPQHLRAKSILDYGIMSCAPITLMSGDIGTGKTTLLRDLLVRVPENLSIGLVANAAAADRTEMLRLVLLALGITPQETESYAALYAQLEGFLVDEYGAGRRVVLIFDEAQNLDRDSLEHLRMLTNINFSDHELVQLILIGQPELLDTISRPDLRQLAQRISAHVALTPIDAKETENYIKHRLGAVGGSSDIFEPDTFALIHQSTEGTPRLINQLCDYALLYAFSADEATVTKTSIQRVLEDNYLLSVKSLAEPDPLGEVQ